MQNEVHHSVDHIIYGYRVSSDYRSQSEGDDSNSDQNEDDEMADISDEDLGIYDDEILIKTEIN